MDSKPKNTERLPPLESHNDPPVVSEFGRTRFSDALDEINKMIEKLKTDANADEDETQEKCIRLIAGTVFNNKDIDVRLLDPGYTNWMKGCLSLQILKECLEPYTLKKAGEVHKQLQTNIKAKGYTCKCSFAGITVRDKMSSRKEIKNNCCDECKTWLSKIDLLTTKTSALVLENTTLSKVKSDKWAFASVFLPFGCGNQDGPSDADVIALLTFLERCQSFNVDRNKVVAVKEVRNKMFHTSNMKLVNDDLTKNKLKITELLKELESEVDIDKVCDEKKVIDNKEEELILTGISSGLEKKQTAIKEMMSEGLSSEMIEEAEKELEQIKADSISMLAFVNFHDIAVTGLAASLSATVDSNAAVFEMMKYQKIREPEQGQGETKRGWRRGRCPTCNEGWLWFSGWWYRPIISYPEEDCRLM